MGIASPSFHMPKAITGINYLSCIVQPSQCPAAMPEPSDLNMAGVFVLLLLSALGISKRNPVALLGFGFFLISIILASSATQLSEGMAHRYVYGTLYLISIAILRDGVKDYLCIWVWLLLCFYLYFTELQTALGIFNHDFFQHMFEVGNHKKTTLCVVQRVRDKRSI